MGRMDYLTDQCDNQQSLQQQSLQNIESDLDMLVLESMYRNTGGRRRSRGVRRHATSGCRNRGIMFWIILAISIYWYFLRPLGW